MMKKGPLGMVAFILLIIGGLNWGLVGFFNFDLVAAIFGDMTTLSRIVYDLVGLAALFMVVKKFMMMGEEKAD
ncbi:MAG: membrane protein [Candidatus Moranbacteria bacterium GW2011_GWC1_45_18]|nr:MAG: membrane protein [Candidatus Moranbacteria bacterium GW2011_GWC2_40_12]KKT33269.1 MAG: membrane protein [Candidatus Moranbacteria bacterium GW2011_GWF2_44_10]KKT99318.1 MAG: membrane protein [Candidatus Moranbacteria bacterium GW2011_GWC1_45_18]OGI36742.1 MAG: DUF378 domain-containing protein [Candidatus Moranbacteria bacterium RIFOXYC1_FULL_44_8]OGI40677.1 MAG: DUF378 domain-containing protein [Candidatus Moranbacteria bacterium RIFOXYB1_FULL_44_23]OGI41456.1 MAG: DUF378 domain-contai